MKAVILATLALAACATTDGAATIAKCDAARLQDLVGKPLAAHEGEAKARAGAAVVRSYATGAALTMDYREDRLNIETDTAGTIVKLSCG